MGNLWVGIDPGKNGGVAIISEGESPKVTLSSMPPTEKDVYQLISKLQYSNCGVMVYLEKVWGMPGQGGGASFTFGKGYGVLLGCLTAAELCFEEIPPQRWMKAMGIPLRKKTESKAQWKNRLRSFAEKLFPREEISIRVADALLLAEHCRRSHSKGV